MTVLEAVRPRFRHVPLFTSSAGQDAVDLAAEAGLLLDQWQRDVLIDAMAEGPDAKWASMRVGLVVPRQNGKGSILEALELFHLFAVPTTDLITHTAHRFDTCLDHFRRIRKLIEDTPDLLELVEDNGRGVGDTPSGIKDSNGKESIKLRDGSRLNFKAREKGSGRGFSGDLVVLDEAFWLKDLSGLIPTMSARANPQVWYTSSAPLPRMESDRLRRLVREGRALCDGKPLASTSKPLTYFEWSVPEGSDVNDPENLRTANPSTEVDRITAEFTYDVERADLTDEEFGRERFGMFPDNDEAPRWLVVPEPQWTARGEDFPLEQPGWLSGQVTLCVEMDKDRSRIWIDVAGDRDGKTGVDVAAQLSNSDELVATVLRLKKTGTVGRVVIDPRSPAGSEIQPLTAAGIDVTECSTADVVKATGQMLDAIRDDQMVHRNRPELTAAVSVAVLRKAGESSVIDRWASPSSAAFIAASLARWGHLQGYEDDDSIYESRGLVEL